MSWRKRYSPECKQEAIRLVQQSDTPVSEIARNPGIDGNMLRQWVKQASEPRKRVYSGHGYPRDEEIARVQRGSRQVKKERDFLREGADTKWGTDTAYLRTGEGWPGLAVVIDLFGAQLVGWSMSHHMVRKLLIQAVLMAWWWRKSKAPVVLHSDRKFPVYQP
ncbi:hypothetical protein E4634_16540 [Mangrovimicrobium sediminis]|uniref:Integrase catalytic domain-containing protein n=1 Tax=Mangrovimicrobium sediminis TaxID=2562682 RepID=A0A4Z0LX66_9GAMM|nr:hypothetical protein E4634_16540 [Haliea sp. SAOS-164]